MKNITCKKVNENSMDAKNYYINLLNIVRLQKEAKKLSNIVANENEAEKYDKKEEKMV